MRIASLVPSATEILFSLDLSDEIVAVTHECDWPPEATDLPTLTQSVVPAGLEAGEIDAAVRGRVDAGDSLYLLDEELLREMEPDLIITQALCAVCAVSFEDVEAVAKRLPSEPQVISLDPTTLGEMMADIRTVAAATNRVDEGDQLVRALADRVDDIQIALGIVGDPEGPTRPRISAIEWFDPPFIGGHWVPQMIAYAGGEDLLGLPGERSTEVSWDQIAASEPEIVIAMPCGYDAARSLEEAERFGDRLAGLGARAVYACDAAAYFSRPGPRLVDGLELLAHTLHPTLVPEPAVGLMLPIELPPPA